MRNVTLSWPILAILLAGCSPAEEAPSAPAVEAADSVYSNGKIYTVDDANSWAEAIAVRDAGPTESRLAMGHTVLVDPADMQRFADLDVIANYYTYEASQPHEIYLARLGPERYANLMRLGTFVDMGVTVTLSQDYPTTPVSPFVHLHAAVTRSHVGDDEILGVEEDKLSVAEGIKAYTLDASKMVAAESYSGSLEVGKRADFIVLDRNLFEIPEDDILDTQVLKTVVDGNVVYERN